MAFPSVQLYEGKLRAHPDAARRDLSSLAHVRRELLDLAPLTFLDTAGRGFDDQSPEESESRQNPGEAELCARQVRKWLDAGLRGEEIAVITPYEAQARWLRHLLPENVEIDTIDAFQGREKEAVCVSLTRSNRELEVGFLSDVRRMNVAITRARRKLLVVGDSATVGAHPFYAAFVAHAQASGGYRSAWEEPES